MAVDARSIDPASCEPPELRSPRACRHARLGRRAGRRGRCFQVAAGVGADSLGSAPALPNAFVWRFATDVTGQQAAARLTGADGITYAYPLVAHDAETLSLPNDTYLPQQWHLNNTAGVGQDLNLSGVWDFANSQGLGTGVVIGVVDDGVQGNHPDLSANYRSNLSASIDSLGNRNNSLTAAYPVGPTDNHGTALAGIAAAVGNNNLGVSGVAAGAGFGGIAAHYVVVRDGDRRAGRRGIRLQQPADRRLQQQLVRFRLLGQSRSALLGGFAERHHFRSWRPGKRFRLRVRQRVLGLFGSFEPPLERRRRQLPLPSELPLRDHRRRDHERRHARTLFHDGGIDSRLRLLGQLHGRRDHDRPHRGRRHQQRSDARGTDPIRPSPPTTRRSSAGTIRLRAAPRPA